MNDSDIKKIVIELAQAQIQNFEALTALVDAHRSVADCLLHHPFDVSPIAEGCILESLNLTVAEIEKLSEHVQKLQSAVSALR